MTNKDFRFLRGILDIWAVNLTLEVGDSPNRRCSKEWATCGRNSGQGSKSNSASSSNIENTQSRTTRFYGSGGREEISRDPHQRKSGALRHKVCLGEDVCMNGTREPSMSWRIGKSRSSIVVNKASGINLFPAISVILCQRSASGMIRSSITPRTSMWNCSDSINQAKKMGHALERSR